MEPLLGELALRFSRLPMFPFFDLAHYAASVLSLKEQRGECLGGGRVTSSYPVLCCWFVRRSSSASGHVQSDFPARLPPLQSQGPREASVAIAPLAMCRLPGVVSIRNNLNW